MRDSGGLFQLTVDTGEAERRKPHNCGYVEKLYADELELGIMQRYDNDLPRLARERKIWELKANQEFRLEQSDRKLVCKWLGLAMIRTPLQLEINEFFTRQFIQDPYDISVVVNEQTPSAVESFKKLWPPVYAQLVETHGEAIAHRHIRDFLLKSAWDRREEIVSKPQQSFESFIRDETLEKFFPIFNAYSWTWVQSDHGFITSDNPVCVWNIRNNLPNAGIGKSDVEITYVFSKSICLLLHKGAYRAGRVQPWGKHSTAELNRRQAVGARHYVYGPSEIIQRIAGSVPGWRAEYRRRIANRQY